MAPDTPGSSKVWRYDETKEEEEAIFTVMRGSVWSSDGRNGVIKYTAGETPVCGRASIANAFELRPYSTQFIIQWNGMVTRPCPF